MKEKIIGFVLVLTLMAGIPLFTSQNKVLNEITTKYLSGKSYSDKEIAYSMVCAKFKKEYNFETLKATAVILYSNYKYLGKIDYNDKKEFLTKKQFCKKYSNQGEKYYLKIKKAVDEVYEKCITYKGKVAYIPCFHCGVGYTKSSKKYPYINNAASPWDLLEKNRTNKKVGISLNGINNLCKNGNSYKQALSRYLNNVKITNYNLIQSK